MRQQLTVLLLCLFGFAGKSLYAQPVDYIAAVVGEEIVLYSDVENQYQYMLANGQEDDGNLRCFILENLVISNLLVNKAIQDSVEIDESRVDGEAERRIAVMVSQAGGREQVEKIYGKPTSQLKEDLIPDIRKQMLAEQMKQKILNSVTVTPREVKEFFKTIPSDSLPYLPAEVEMYQLLIQPPYSEASIEKAKEKLSQIREELVENDKDFATMAKLYSMGPSGKQGGLLGDFKRGSMVKEFDEIVFNLKEGEISQPFVTNFGVHIAKLHKRMGEKVRASHILIVPERTFTDDSLAIKKLNAIRDSIVNHGLSFERAAIRYSEDAQSKDCGGCVRDMETGEHVVSMDMLDADLFLKVEEMEVGAVSQPMEVIQLGQSTKLFHILYLKKRLPPHKANLKDDYKKFQAAARQNKQSGAIQEWLEKAKKQIYIEILMEECQSSLNNWN